MLYFCCNEGRREVTLKSGFNGIDYLEVLDSEAPFDPPGHQLRQQVLKVYLLKPLGNVLNKENVQIEGGDRIRDIQVIAITASPNSNEVQVRVNQWGDFSTYTLRFVQDSQHPQPPSWLDPILSFINFSFKVECPSEFDCHTERICPPEPHPQPEINYLAKDYASFRQLMLDRMALLMPDWQERNPADLGMALVELLAYVGDHLSYQQDAIATEAYLGTARQRTSIRRHTRLVDYSMHDGCNARTWVQIQIKTPKLELPQVDKDTGIRTRFLTQCSDAPLIPPEHLQEILSTQKPIVFEPMHDVTLHQGLNRLYFYTWSESCCCLPKGVTRATLNGDHPNLKAGMVLIVQEVLDPETGEPEDANPTHRHAVQLTAVNPCEDPLVRDAANQPTKLTEIVWSDEDALPFPVCISSTKLDPAGNQVPVSDVSVMLGNIVLADHGLTQAGESLRDGDHDRVPPIRLYKIPQLATGNRCQAVEPLPIFPRFRPQLSAAPLTFAVPYKSALSDNSPPSATATMQVSAQAAQGAILSLTDSINHQYWYRVPDLLTEHGNDPAFVVETETNGTAFLRFGDNTHGLRPTPDSQFTATYRTGNGTAGNIGAEAIAHIVCANSASDQIEKVWNPLPARGGTQPEAIEDVRQRAPSAFRTQERAVTPEDYAAMAERFPGIQRAVATFRWTGSWYTVLVCVDRIGGLRVDSGFKTQLRQHLERYRMAGHDLEIEDPIGVPLEIEMRVCVKPGYFRDGVKRALLQVFSSKVLPNGQPGIFHPDNFTFGQTVYLSPLYATAQAVDGVASVCITIFQRQGTPSNTALNEGKLVLGHLEIARLDNDPNFPDRGVFRLQMEGGK